MELWARRRSTDLSDEPEAVMQRERQRQALEINDNIVQGLFVAQAALAMGEREVCEEALRATLASARNIISDLLGDSGSDFEIGPGQLVRQTAAVVAGSLPAPLTEP